MRVRNIFTECENTTIQTELRNIVVSSDHLYTILISFLLLVFFRSTEKHFSITYNTLKPKIFSWCILYYLHIFIKPYFSINIKNDKTREWETIFEKPVRQKIYISGFRIHFSSQKRFRKNLGNRKGLEGFFSILQIVQIKWIEYFFNIENNRYLMYLLCK